MADTGLTLNAGSGGSSLAVDSDASSRLHQYVKIEFGASGTQTHVDTSNPLPVDLRADNLSGNLDVNLAASAATVTVDSELPAASTLADNMTNPTAPLVGSCMLAFDGTTWDRVSVGGGTQATALRVTIASDSTGVLSVDDNGATLSVDDGGGNLSIDLAGTSPSLNDGATDGGTLRVTLGNVHTADFDTGAGTDTTPCVGIALPASGGAVVGGTSTNPLRVDPTGSTTQPVSGTVTVQDGGGTISVDDAGGSLTVDGTVTVQDGGGSLTVDGTVTANAGSGTFAVGGVAAHDAAVSGNPVLAGAEARSSMPTAVANGDVTRLQADTNGRLSVMPFGGRFGITSPTRTALSTTSETTILSGTASVYRDLVLLVLSNESASEVRVDIRDGTAGTIVLSVDLAADGGGAVIQPSVPILQAAKNNNWTAQLSTAASTVYVTAVAVQTS